MKTLVIAWLLLAGVFVAFPALAADTVRVCTYNLVNYSLTNEAGRSAKFKMIMDTIRPDVLVVQEMVNSEAAAKFGVDVFGGTYQSPKFISASTNDVYIYFNPAKFTIVTAVNYEVFEARDVAEYRLVHIASGDSLSVFTSHFPASTGFVVERNRRTAATMLINKAIERDMMNGNIIAAGDFNLYSTNEPAYYRLLNPESGVGFIDPLGSTWKRNDTTQAAIYTQSPRTGPDAACGGGVGGGMDDRFDYVLTSKAMHQKMIPGSYTVFGNDGVPRLDSGIDDPPNQKHSAEMAAALRCASDHLPVYADFVFGGLTSVNEEPQATYQEQPRYYDILGREVKEPVKGGMYLRVQGSTAIGVVY